MGNEAELLPGTLDLLILKAVSLGPLHGYGVLLRIEQISGRALLIEQGALYPALFRLVRQGLLKASWGSRIIIGARNFTNSHPKGANVCARKRMDGTDWLRLSPLPWRHDHRKYESERTGVYDTSDAPDK